MWPGFVQERIEPEPLWPAFHDEFGIDNHQGDDGKFITVPGWLRVGEEGLRLILLFLCILHVMLSSNELICLLAWEFEQDHEQCSFKFQVNLNGSRTTVWLPSLRFKWTFWIELNLLKFKSWEWWVSRSPGVESRSQVTEVECHFKFGGLCALRPCHRDCQGAGREPESEPGPWHRLRCSRIRVKVPASRPKLHGPRLRLPGCLGYDIHCQNSKPSAGIRPSKLKIMHCLSGRATSRLARNVLPSA